MKILVAGDFCPQLRVAQLFNSGNFNTVLGEVKPIIEQSDYSIVNFECPVCSGEEKPINKCGPNLHCSESGIEALKWVGVKGVTLANNHFLDYGSEGAKNTISACAKRSIDIVGGGMNYQEAASVLYKNVGGQTLAVISCCEHEFSIAGEETAGSNPLNPVQQYYSIKEAHEKADFVLVIVHGGHEHFQLPSLRMQELYRFFIDVGADVVVNHHQHCFSGYEIYHDKPIFYGLGNFCFDKQNKRSGIWNEGYMVSMDFNIKSMSFEIHPYIQCAEEPGIKFLAKDAFKEKLEKLNKIISNPMALKEEINKYYTSCEVQYSSIFEPIQNNIYLMARRKGWLPSFINKKRKIIAENFVVCESHRDKLIYWLSK